MTVVFLCKNSGMPAFERLPYAPDEMQVIEIPCGGALDVLEILRAVERGAERVVIVTCRAGVCRSLVGYRHAERKVARANELLAEISVNVRIELHQLAANEPGRLGGLLEPPPQSEGEAEA